ncbi:MAG TPA: serine hydrolase [Ramlibacter sp.]|nr:serine hydrolase [Ramlibacter sp.]
MHALVLALACVAAHAEPDEAQLGKDRGYPVGTTPFNWNAPAHRVGSFSAMDRVPGLRHHPVARGREVRALPPAASAPAVHWRWRGATLTLDDYLERHRATGLLILKDGAVVAERYRYDRKPDARFMSFSMGKSITSMLVGIAVERGHIASLDDPAGRYVPALQGSAYGETPIRHLLRMSSGVAFSERYDGQDDVARLSRAAITGRPPVLEVLRSFSERRTAPGERFAYASAETDVLGRVLSGATGRPLAQLASEWLWQHLGAEHDAFWILAHDGQERASGYFNATLRDWGRLGLLLAADGQVGERQVVPREYLLDATEAARQPAAFQPGTASPFLGYGYQFWILPQRERTFALQGVFGQAVYVQPATGIVMVQTAVWDRPSGSQDRQAAQERQALWLGVLRSLGGRAD